MKRIAGMFGAAALAATMVVSSLVPSSAAPVVSVPVKSSGLVETVQFGMRDNPTPINRGWGGRKWRGGGDRYWGGRPSWGGPRYGYYNGYRGYRHKRHGYRYHNGFWFPAGAFIAGAIISGALNQATQPPRYYRGGSSHTSWCYNRYRSYREYDNTYQPYNGPRRQCYSPYS